jgi:hypothetical protein
MFYFPLKLRSSKTLIVPKGPSFKKAKTYEIDFEGTKLTFKAPKDSQKISKYEFSFPAKKLPYGLRFGHYGDVPYHPKELQEKWEHAPCYKSGWAFNGPWFTGTVSDLKLSMTAYRIKNYPETVSLFHPRAFEKIISDYLTIFYSEIFSHNTNIQMYSAPLDWKTFDVGDVYGAHFKLTYTLTNILSGSDLHFVFIPIDHRTLACFKFDTARLGLIPETSHNKISSLEPLYELMNNIIDSIKVELSPEAKLQKELAQEGLEDPSLVKDFPPIKWDKLDDQTRARILEQDERDRIAEFGC